MIRGQLWLDGDHTRLRRVRLIGPTGSVRRPGGGESNPLVVNADAIEVSGCEVSRSAWHAGIHVYRANSVALIGNYVHGNGDASDPSHANLDHGIYWGSGTGGLIANNLIAGNVARGVQLYPRASRVLVVNNTIVGNGKAGVIVSNGSSFNLIVNNVIAFGRDVAFRSSDLSGQGNSVRNNLIWSHPRVPPPDHLRGLAISGIRDGDPLFKGGGNFRVRRGGPADGWAERRLAPSHDFDGRRRSRSAPDVGAFELR